MTRSVGAQVDEQVRRSEVIGRSAAPPTTAASPVPASYQVVTISRSVGSGGRLVAERVGRALGWNVWDKALLENVAQLAHVKPSVVEAFDEHAIGDLGRLVHMLVGNTEIASFPYGTFLRKGIEAVARQGKAVLLGRGANFVLPNALHVLIDAPEAMRVANMVQFEHMDAETAQRTVHESDRERRKALHELYGRGTVEEARYDLVLSMAKLSVDDAAAILRTAIEHRCRMVPQGGETC